MFAAIDPQNFKPNIKEAWTLLGIPLSTNCRRRVVDELLNDDVYTISFDPAVKNALTERDDEMIDTFLPTLLRRRNQIIHCRASTKNLVAQSAVLTISCRPKPRKADGITSRRLRRRGNHRLISWYLFDTSIIESIIDKSSVDRLPRFLPTRELVFVSGGTFNATPETQR